jgi:hypothetical protein
MPPTTGHRLLELERAFDEGYRRLMAEPPSSQSLMTDEMEELVQLQEQHRSITMPDATEPEELQPDATPPEELQPDAPSARNTSNRVAMLRIAHHRDCYSHKTSPGTGTGSPTLHSLHPR